MRWSLKIASFGGTAVHIHVTFLLLLLWIGYVGWQRGGAPAAMDGIVFVSLVFLCVLLHEFGHVLTARRYGIPTPDITLLPIGGVARLQRMPEKPRQELAVAAAGPLVNVVIAALLVLIFGAKLNFGAVDIGGGGIGSMAARLATVNVALVVFNLIPAFPLDGGRMFRALLAMRFDRATATRYAARTGQAFAVLFALLGLLGNPILFLIAIFIFFAADAEAGQEQMRATASAFRARDAMVTSFAPLDPDATADDAGRLLLVTTQQEFPVIDRGGALLGMVTRKGLVDAMRRTGPQTPVRSFMETDLHSVPAGAPLERVMTDLVQSPLRAVAVRDPAGRFLGYVSAENAAELFLLAAARRDAARRA